MYLYIYIYTYKLLGSTENASNIKFSTFSELTCIIIYTLCKTSIIMAVNYGAMRWAPQLASVGEDGNVRAKIYFETRWSINQLRVGIKIGLRESVLWWLVEHPDGSGSRPTVTLGISGAEPLGSNTNTSVSLQDGKERYFLTLYAPWFILQYVYKPTRCTKFLWLDFIFY